MKQKGSTTFVFRHPPPAIVMRQTANGRSLNRIRNLNRFAKQGGG